MKERNLVTNNVLNLGGSESHVQDCAPLPYVVLIIAQTRRLLVGLPSQQMCHPFSFGSYMSSLHNSAPALTRPFSLHSLCLLLLSHTFLLLLDRARLPMLLIHLSFFAMRSVNTFLFRIRFRRCLATIGAANNSTPATALSN